MSKIKEIAGRLEDGQITTEIPLEEVGREVMNGNICVIKQAFPADKARRLRDLAFDWGQAQPVSAQKDFYSHTKENHFCTERGISAIQKTLHHYRSHNLNDYTNLEPLELRELLAEFCLPLQSFYNRVTGNQAEFGGERRLHPQIIHYPSGGGFFARHTHALEPQRIGLIVSLSKYGEDFNQGGTGFDVDGEIVEIEPHHDVGDVGMFRFDLPHWVSPIDIEEAMQPDSPRGRWTLVMPYY